MPGEDIRITRSAGINFGVPNSEYRLRIDPVTGEAVSCYNQDTDTEYIGGGGDSDFSTAEVTITSELPRWIAEFNLPYISENELYSSGSANSVSGDETIINIILYKGKCNGNIYSEDGLISVSGNATLNGDDIVITGNCTIEIAGE